MAASDKELAVEIVVAVINSNMEKRSSRVQYGSEKLTVEDIPELLSKVYEAVSSLKSSSK